MPWSLDAFSDMADFGGAVQTEMTKGNPILSLPRLFPCGIQLKGGIIWPGILRIYKGGRCSCLTREESRRVPSGGSVQIAVKSFGL